jgi:N-acetyl-anhydromuramyl-L-alanine amidase AmpD
MARRHTAAAFARRHKWKLIHGHLAGLLIGLLVAFLLGAFTGSGLKTVFGQKLNKTGLRLYKHLDHRNVEQGQRTGSETPPEAVAERIARLNASLPHLTPRTLATPEPVTLTSFVRNYSSRVAGAHPVLLVVHDAEMPNAPGTQDLRAIAAWFNNPAAQASSNYATDSDGNTIMMVPTSAKAWTQAWFNSWAISDELLGYASQTAWPDTQLRAVAQLFAHDAVTYGIPIQHGAVSGCTIVRPGILEHVDLGACGGGHHDAGPNFPISRFIGLVNQYAAALRHPVSAPPATTTSSSRTAATVLRAKTGYWSWLAWRLAAGGWKG